jgi:hypothetical protein
VAVRWGGPLSYLDVHREGPLRGLFFDPIATAAHVDAGVGPHKEYLKPENSSDCRSLLGASECFHLRASGRMLKHHKSNKLHLRSLRNLVSQ